MTDKPAGTILADEMAKGRKTGGRTPQRNKIEIQGSVAILWVKRQRSVLMPALIDVDMMDAVRMAPCAWYVVSRGKPPNITHYVRTMLPASGSHKPQPVFLHHLITGCPLPPSVVDHRDHNGLNNTRENLRITDNVTNCLNRRGANGNSKSGVRGVSWDKARAKWTAHTTVAGFGQRRPRAMHRKVISLGRFDTIEEATAAIQRSLSAATNAIPGVD